MANSPDQQEIHKLLTLFNQGRNAEAETIARSMTSRFPLWGFGWKALGAVQKQLGRNADALKTMQIATKLAPGDAEVHSNLGTVLHELGNIEEAAASCRRALKIRPNFAEAHNNLGISLVDLGQLSEAEACFRRALEFRPLFSAAYFNLHALLMQSDDLTPAIKCMEKAVEIDPSSDERRFFLGMLLDYTGNYRAAEEQFAIVASGADLYRAKLDAWRYLESACKTRPLITGSSTQTFKLAVDIAVNDGLVLEFGVRFGTSIRQIAGMVEQEVHGFDSFEGLPEQWNDESKGSYSTHGELPDVPGNVHLHAGWFEDTLPEFLKSHSAPVRLMNIDCDIYSSTKTVLDLLSNRVVPGTVIVFDEYIGNEHWRDDEFRAFQEAVVTHDWHYRYVSFSFFTKQVVVQIV
ncbi:MAG: tetratricopeptide repeat protein [Sulfuritalea sp.]|nr:tetratricopeptide repeat protein [Sulfuritalea sp.]